ncbi:TetR/AcrR family transcriptional regulator [Chitinibacter sp. SCUT-21]|uniref:TetR/AcrR family transcriptional regulator n=1 Tax=Chitinibacter sp. SCUT-21 TaxID=2970891 RepID=UPI0035A61C3F
MNPPISNSKLNESKRTQILVGARAVFLETGYAAASMERIAKTAGVSKGTLYNYFVSKEELFIALIEEECSKSKAPFNPPTEYSDTPPEVILNLIGKEWLMGLADDNQRAFFRIVLAEVMQFPELGRAIEKSGPEQAIANLSRYLAHLHEQQLLEIANPHLAAEQFFALCDSGIVRKMQLSVAEPTLDTIISHTEQAVQLFIRAHRRT